MTLSKLLRPTCYAPNEEAIIFQVEFETAQFRKHLIKLYRDTYLIPLPSSVLGFIGAVLGVERRNLRDFACKNGVMTGAAMLGYEGLISETMTIIKVKGWRDFVRTPKRSVLLYRPSYVFAVSSTGEVVEELTSRLQKMEFQYEVFGGNDYNFLLDVKSVRRARYVETDRGVGYCRLSEVEGWEGKGELRVDEVNDGEVSKYAFSYNLTLKTVRRPAVTDGSLTVFVHESWRFLR